MIYNMIYLSDVRILSDRRWKLGDRFWEPRDPMMSITRLVPLLQDVLAELSKVPQLPVLQGEELP